MKLVQIKKRYVNQYKKGYPLITPDVLVSNLKQFYEGDLFGVTTQNGEWIGQAYYGLQNKGIGWIITKDKKSVKETLFKDKLSEAMKKRKNLFDSDITTAFRIFNGEGDGIGGLTIDDYNGYYLINWYSQGIYKYRKWVVNSLNNLLEVKGIYHKKRFGKGGRVLGESSFLEGEKAPEPLIVQENNIYFAVYLDDGPMVGYFLDQREVRYKIMTTYSKDWEVLNTFSYTGAFSVAAALGGAAKTTSVDLANRSRKRTIEHFELNGLDASQHSIIVEDVFQYFKYAVRKKLLFDMVILDPPSFAKSKKHIFRAEKDYTALMKETITITRREGIIVASTNCSSFNMTKFKSFIKSAFEDSNCRYEVLEEYSLPLDFVTSQNFIEGNYLKVLFVKKL